MPLLEEIRDNLDDQARVNRAISRIDVLRSKMNELHDAYQLITQLTQNTELKRFHADRKIGAAKIDANEKQRRQVQRDIDNVQGVIDASIEFQKLMRETRRADRCAASSKKPEGCGMKNITAILSMLHEPAERNCCDATLPSGSSLKLDDRSLEPKRAAGWGDDSLLGRSGRIDRADRGGRSCRHARQRPAPNDPEPRSRRCGSEVRRWMARRIAQHLRI